MKKVIVLLAVLAVTANAFAAITGSAHDFTDGSGQDIAGGKFCEPCHVPHVTANTVGAPLWNHAVSGESFTNYVGATPTSLDGTISAPGSTSLLCLSCHDGVTNLDAFGGAIGTGPVTGSAVVGTDLKTSHPISITYNTGTATADGALHNPSVVSSGLAGGGTIDADLLFGGSVECASCHDVHNGASVAGLLVKSNAASDLCMTCHDK